MKLSSLVVAATRAGVAAWFGALACSPAGAQGIDYSRLEITTTDLGNGVYLLNWQGGDSLILVGDEGVLLVDTSVAAMGDKINAAIAKVSDKPVSKAELQAAIEALDEDAPETVAPAEA